MRGIPGSGIAAVTYPGTIVAGSGTGGIVVDSTPGGGTGGGGAGGGGLTVDRTTYLSYAARDRKVGARVEVIGDPLTGLYGDVQLSWSLRDPVKHASFSVADKRVSRYAPVSLADGDKDVTITLLAGPSSSIQSWEAFFGHTDGSTNDGPYLPRATFRAISYAGDWIGLPGCVRSTGFQGTRRGDIIYRYALSAGIPIDPAVQYLGRIVSRPFEYNAVPILDIFDRLGEIEGFFPRITADNVLTFVSDRYVFTGEPVFDFTDSNVYNLTDETPQHPPTIFALSGSRMTQESLGDAVQTTVMTPVVGADATTGAPYATYTWITSERGTVIRSVVEEWETFSLDGVTAGPLDFQLRRRTEIENTWERATPLYYEMYGRLTTRLNRRVQRTYDTTGVPCDAATGYTWASGAHCVAASAALMLVQERTWDCTWNEDVNGQPNCTLASQTETIKEFYAPQKPSGAGGVLYADGTYRDGAAYTWRTVEEATENWFDFRLYAIQPEVRVTRRLSRYAVTAISGPDITETYVTAAETQFEDWLGNATNTHYIHTLQIHSATISSPTLAQGGQRDNAGRLLAGTREEVDGPVPGPPVGSPVVPQFQQERFTSTYTVTLPYQPNKVAEVIEAAEDEDELQSVAMRRLVMALCNTVKLVHPTLPYLQPGDPVTLTNAARNLVAQRGYVDVIDIACDVTAGRAVQTTTVKLIPHFPVWPRNQTP